MKIYETSLKRLQAKIKCSRYFLLVLRSKHRAGGAILNFKFSPESGKIEVAAHDVARVLLLWDLYQYLTPRRKDLGRLYEALEPDFKSKHTGLVSFALSGQVSLLIDVPQYMGRALKVLE
jgi:hypothetical protein